MNVSERVWICRLIEKMGKQENYSRRLGLTNASTFRGMRQRRKGEWEKPGE